MHEAQGVALVCFEIHSLATSKPQGFGIKGIQGSILAKDW